MSPLKWIKINLKSSSSFSSSEVSGGLGIINSPRAASALVKFYLGILDINGAVINAGKNFFNSAISAITPDLNSSLAIAIP